MTSEINDAAHEFTENEFRAKALMHIHGILPDTGDHLLNPLIAEQLLAISHRNAAVLVGFRPAEAGGSLILTQRAAHLREHGGQVAFPGGTVDAQDASPIATALREAHEEIGLASHFVEPLGVLPDYLTATGFRITPVLALVSPAAVYQINRDEVDAIFEVPFSHLMNVKNYTRESRVWMGSERHFYSMSYEDRLIWGVTANIIRVLQERFYG